MIAGNVGFVTATSSLSISMVDVWGDQRGFTGIDARDYARRATGSRSLSLEEVPGP